MEPRAKLSRVYRWCLAAVTISGLTLSVVHCAPKFRPAAAPPCQNQLVKIDAAYPDGVDQSVILLCADKPNKVTWDAAGKDFSVDFTVSPFSDDNKHFDKNKAESTGTKKLDPNNPKKYEYFKYTVSIGGKTFDPGVIIVE